MKFLLDTHTLLWAVQTPERLSRMVAEALSASDAVVFVSAASAWEIGTKVRLGKFPEAELLERRFMEVMAVAGYTLLPITAEIALRSARLPGPHRNPFDRMLAAHALAEDIPIVSADPVLDTFGVRRFW